MKRNDLILIGAILIISAIFFFVQFLVPSSENADIEITVDGEVFGTYPLSQEKSININDTNQLLIENGYAVMKEADCPDQLCVHQNEISKDGESIICLPNKVVVTVVGGEERDVDTVSN